MCILYPVYCNISNKLDIYLFNKIVWFTNINVVYKRWKNKIVFWNLTGIIRIYYCLQWNNIETALKYSNDYITLQRIANVRWSFCSVLITRIKICFRSVYRYTVGFENQLKLFRRHGITAPDTGVSRWIGTYPTTDKLYGACW